MDDVTRLLIDAAKRVLPKGYTVVPVEPTDAMLQIGGERIKQHGHTCHGAAHTYAAMLEAAE